MSRDNNLKFIDLFAGLGGFHLAMERLGHECVFASENNTVLAELYKKNFDMEPAGDIRKFRDNVPKHDVLCAGFPCQPFSKAGSQQGLECPQWGDLINDVLYILNNRKPTYFIIENVPNIVNHNQGKTWKKISKDLKQAGYAVKSTKLSPHQFGIPQVRKRTFIVGKRSSLDGFKWPKPTSNGEVSIDQILDIEPIDAVKLSSQHIKYLKTWQEFIARFPTDIDFPSFPIWAREFGATYPLDYTPFSTRFKGMGHFRGSFGQKFKYLRTHNIIEALPPYALDKTDLFPKWKIDIIKKNRELYKRHKKIINPWLPKIKSFAPSFQKLEWNCKGSERNIWQHIIQFRTSGIRVRKPKTAPSLVAMATSQVPVIAREQRYLTPRECSKLQSMEKLKYLPEKKSIAYDALGNAVNVEVVFNIASALLNATTKMKSRSSTKNKHRRKQTIKHLAHAK